MIFKEENSEATRKVIEDANPIQNEVVSGALIVQYQHTSSQGEELVDFLGVWKKSIGMMVGIFL